MAKTDTAYDTRAEQLSLPLMLSKSFNHPAGTFRRAEGVLEAIKTTLKRCSLSPEQIADEMSRLLGESVTKSHISNWSAESKTGYRLPLQWAAAFCVVTNDSAVIKAAFLGTGINILDDTEMVFYEIGKAVEEKRERDAKLKESRNRLKTLRAQGKM